ncbi:PREDICTED: axonemal dynein light chain domain-containing protein 1 [Cyprinodon variegatus]|uniref:axonemal dynein light chain domain-containing protein 1 n=1 Tax=Cyprinodon variegatus TaxID=28743 RepID=UPI0007427D06|nr:PREDICTED: axonemal dynein light chain domain-containing protein 1 [Cyprinodon variegatus]
MSLSTARDRSAPGSPREQRAYEADLNIQTLLGIRKKQPPTVRPSSIPDELLLSFTSTVSSRNTQGHTAHHRNCESCGVRRPDAVWHHPFGRNKYKYLLEQPTSLTGAGRDISFLCDGGVKQKKMTLLPPVNEQNSIRDPQDLSIPEAVIPEEFHIVKNKGIQCLELYEDAFTVQLKDQEKRLRVLPSLRPSGRLEAIQLMRMMDDMLEKAGVDQQSEELTEMCQLEGLLELVKTEQKIYNIVFHEVIRQVTVGCAERGQLLAKLRQRYQSLLDGIPRRLMALHTEMVAQRAVDRRLIEEIHRIKASIQQLNTELSNIRDHEAFVSQQVDHGQQQLAEGLRETHSSSDVVQGYHQLYELHRARLEDQLLQITEDRDLWSQFTFSLALEVIKVKKLQVFRELHVAEECWFKTAKHCLLFISTKDAEDLHNIVELTSYWKEQLIMLMSQLKRTEHAQFAQLTSTQQSITKWSNFLKTQKKGSDPEYGSSALEEIIADVKQCSHMLSLQCEEYQGEKQLLLQQKLNELRSVQKKWLDVSLQLFKRHTYSDAESAESPQTIRALDRVLIELLKQFELNLSGENGIHRLMMSLVWLMESWTSTAIAGIDWFKLEEALFNWKKLTEEILLQFSTAKTQNQKDQNKHDFYREGKKALDDIQEFTSSLTNFTESKNQKLEEEVISIHIAQTRWMLDLMLVMVPNQSDEEDEDLNDDCSVKRNSQALLEDAKTLAEKLLFFSTIINRSCNLILEETMILGSDTTEMENETNECKKLQRACDHWVETSKILLTGLHGKSTEKHLIKRPEQSLSSTNPAESIKTMGSADPLVDSRHDIESISDETKPESTEGEPLECDRPVLKLIDYDGNITEKYLEESSVQLTGTDQLIVSPVTEEDSRAFSDLTTVVLLQQELSNYEMRAKNAEQRALKAEEALHAALETIQDLERRLQSPPAPEPQREKIQTPPSLSAPSVPTAASPNPSIGEAKPSSTTKKTKKP